MSNEYRDWMRENRQDVQRAIVLLEDANKILSELSGFECVDSVSRGVSVAIDALREGSNGGEPGALPDKWRRLADSWLAATKGMDEIDDCRVRAVARANAYRDCADELESNREITCGGAGDASHRT